MNKKWRKDAIESFEQAKIFLIGNAGMKSVANIVSEILEIENFPNDKETIHAVTEENLVKALFICHANAISRMISIVQRMIKDGVLEPNGEKARKMAEKIGAEIEVESDDESDDQGDDE
jgi:hypothetical protein